ncbi:tetrapyrrole methylase, partial [Rubrivivax gelatinosus]|nr:tetrapyrrole methylase [Rubrivivax gelatinosus]
MRRSWACALLWLVLAAAPSFANEALEAEVAEIERLGIASSWRDANASIQALSPRLDALSREQRQRVEFVRLRMLGLSGDEVGAMNGLGALLREPLPPALRVRVYSTAISTAANVEEWSRAFVWLDEALADLDRAPQESASLLGVASYLHTLVGESEKARELAMRELALVDQSQDQRAQCLALSDIAIAEEHLGRFRDAERWRRRQIDACVRAGDIVYAANGKYGIGKMLASQGRHDEALGWAEQALVEFGKAGYAAGAWSTRLMLAGSLIESGRDLGRAGRLLADTLKYYRGHEAHLAIAETEHFLARLAEKRGDLVEALVHYKATAAATASAESDARERRLAFLQVQFDTRLKEQQIALLQAEKELAALQVTSTQRRQLLMGAGLGGLLLIAILLTVLLRRSLLERRRYRWQSEHDGLTRLYNYQQVRKLGEAAFAGARRRAQPFT